MKLVETDEEGPPHPEPEPIKPAPPPPQRRRVAVSLIFTIAVLSGTVIGVYTLFPARNNHLLETALGEHRREAPSWQLDHPGAGELHAWAVAVLGDPVPLPGPATGATIVGVRTIDVLNRRAAVVRYQVGPTAVTLVVQHARGLPPRRVHRVDGGDVLESWRSGPWTFVAIGSATTADTWRPAVSVP